MKQRDSQKSQSLARMEDDYAEEGDLYGDETEETTFETGQIMKVYVQDFMCHHKLTIDFGRHVNFVTGANGSGLVEISHSSSQERTNSNVLHQISD